MSITHFLYWTLKLDLKPLDTHCTLRKNIFLMWRRVQFKVQFASNWSLGFWSLDPCLKFKYTSRCWFKGFRPHAWAFKIKCSVSWIIYVIIYTGTITIWSEAYYRQYSTLFHCLKDSKLIMFRGQPNFVWCFTMYYHNTLAISTHIRWIIN